MYREYIYLYSSFSLSLPYTLTPVFPRMCMYGRGVKEQEGKEAPRHAAVFAPRRPCSHTGDRFEARRTRGQVRGYTATRANTANGAEYA